MQDSPEQNTAPHVRVTFTDMAYGGDAVGRDADSGLAVFAWPAIQGEEATVRITARRPKFVRGQVTEIHTVSESRTEPPCPVFGVCGGCQWQHISYEFQLSTKNRILRAQLERIGGVSEAELNELLGDPIAAPRPFNYRNGSQFSIESVSKTLAYHTRGGHELVPISHCPISNGGINTAIPVVNSMIAGGMTEGEVGADRHGLMRVTRIGIRSSESTGQTVVVFYSTPDTPSGKTGRRNPANKPAASQPEDPNIEVTTGPNPALYISRREMRRAVRALSADTGTNGEGEERRAPLALTAIEVMHDGTINLLGETRGSHALTSEILAEAYTGALLGRRGEIAHGQGRPTPPLGAWAERLGNRMYWVAPQAFFQVNTEAADLLLAEVMSHVPQKLGLAVDAHAGVGTFAIQLAARAERVFGFETERAAVVSAQWTARAHSLENISYSLGRAEQLLARLPNELRPDMVLLDPPRSGCHPQLLSEITRRAVPHIVYVSCDPSTLARDIKILSPNYRLISVRMVDLFPQTYHIETVAVLAAR